MAQVAIVAIVAMFLVFLARSETSPSVDSPRESGPAEVILYIDPPLVIDPHMSLPDRNPVR